MALRGIYITGGLPEFVDGWLKEMEPEGIHITRIPESAEEYAKIQDKDQVELLICRQGIVNDVVPMFPNLKWLQLLNAGFERVDTAMLQQRGILFTNSSSVYCAGIADDVIAKRLQKADSSIGFGAEVTSKSEKPTFDELIHQVRPEDLMQYGIIPEIIGRLPIICTLETLDEDALLRILTEPKNAPVKQYEKLLAMDNVKLEFAEDALRAVAKKAIERKTGARSLKGIIEDVMLDVMYDIPKSKEPRKVIITKACIDEGKKPEVIALDK